MRFFKDFNPFQADVLFLYPLKSGSFLTFSRGIEIEHCSEMNYNRLAMMYTFKVNNQTWTNIFIMFEVSDIDTRLFELVDFKDVFEWIFSRTEWDGWIIFSANENFDMK